MRLFLCVFSAFVGLTILMVDQAYALGGPSCGSMRNRKSHCGLWICLPGGMGPGCQEMAAALAQRYARECPPLPPYLVCASKPSGSIAATAAIGAAALALSSGGGGSNSSGNNDIKNEGSYKEGFDELRKCDPGFKRQSVYKEGDTSDNIFNSGRDDRLLGAHCVNENLGPDACQGAGYNYNRIEKPFSDDGDYFTSCSYYMSKRKYPYWIEVTVNGTVYKKYWHDGRGKGPAEGSQEYELNELESLGLSAKEALDAYASGSTAKTISENKIQSELDKINNDILGKYNTDYIAGSSTTTTSPSSNNTSAITRSPPPNSNLIPGTSLQSTDLPTRQIVDDY